MKPKILRGHADISAQLKVLCVVIFQLAYFTLHPSFLLNTLGHKGGFLIHFVSREAAGEWGLVPQGCIKAPSHFKQFRGQHVGEGKHSENTQGKGPD